MKMGPREMNPKMVVEMPLQALWEGLSNQGTARLHGVPLCRLGLPTHRPLDEEFITQLASRLEGSRRLSARPALLIRVRKRRSG